MALSPRAIAVAGVGYAAAVLAREGFWSVAAASSGPPFTGVLWPWPKRPPRAPDDEDEETMFIFTATRQ